MCTLNLHNDCYFEVLSNRIIKMIILNTYTQSTMLILNNNVPSILHFQELLCKALQRAIWYSEGENNNINLLY